MCPSRLCMRGFPKVFSPMRARESKLGDEWCKQTYEKWLDFLCQLPLSSEYSVLTIVIHLFRCSVEPCDMYKPVSYPPMSRSGFYVRAAGDDSNSPRHAPLITAEFSISINCIAYLLCLVPPVM